MASLAAEIEAIVHMFYIWSKKKIKNTILEVSEPLDGIVSQKERLISFLIEIMFYVETMSLYYIDYYPDYD